MPACEGPSTASRKKPASTSAAVSSAPVDPPAQEGECRHDEPRHVGAGEVEASPAEDVDVRLEAGRRDVEHVAEPRHHEPGVRQTAALAVADGERPVQRQVHDRHEQEHADGDAPTDPQHVRALRHDGLDDDRGEHHAPGEEAVRVPERHAQPADGEGDPWAPAPLQGFAERPPCPRVQGRCRQRGQPAGGVHEQRVAAQRDACAGRRGQPRPHPVAAGEEVRPEAHDHEELDLHERRRHRQVADLRDDDPVHEHQRVEHAERALTDQVAPSPHRPARTGGGGRRARTRR